jgi:hypothetical protein
MAVPPFSSWQNWAHGREYTVHRDPVFEMRPVSPFVSSEPGRDVAVRVLSLWRFWFLDYSFAVGPGRMGTPASLHGQLEGP